MYLKQFIIIKCNASLSGWNKKKITEQQMA